MENRGILFVFPVFHSAWMGKKIRFPAADDLFRDSIVHLLHRRPPLSQNSHPLCDLDIDFEHIDSLLAKDAKDFALGIF